MRWCETAQMEKKKKKIGKKVADWRLNIMLHREQDKLFSTHYYKADVMPLNTNTFFIVHTIIPFKCILLFGNQFSKRSVFIIYR